MSAMRTPEPTLRHAPDKPRVYTFAERLADGGVHAIGIGASVLGVAALMIAARNLPAGSIVSLGVYGFGLVAVFACSACYHLASEARLKSILRRFDHAAIYVKIAGTYTPFAAIKMGDAAGFALLGAVWAITAFGATAKLLWPGRLVRTSYVLYLAQGWAIVAAFGPFASAVSGRVLALLVVGGVTYTVGVIFHLWERLPFHNAVWHALVLVASACHFAAIVDAVGLAPGA
jgi:hemolysin III